MQTRYSPTEYLYASTRIRALENGLIGKAKLDTLLLAATNEELLAALKAATTAQGDDVEAALLAMLREGIDSVKRSIPDASLTHVIEYPYDCHNVKSYLKATARGIDPATLLIDAGTVPAGGLINALEAGELSLLPPHMAAAVPAANEAFAKTADPREIDFILDRALFEDLSDAAAGLPFAERLISARADLTNVLVCLRLLRGKHRKIARTLFGQAMLPGGRLPESFFEVGFHEGEGALLTALVVSTPYGRVAAGADKRTMAELERMADDYLTALLREVKYLSFGAEIPLAYLWGLETSIKNVRILLASKKAGLDDATLRERIRESYV